MTPYRTLTFGGARVGPLAYTAHGTERPVDSARASRPAAANTTAGDRPERSRALVCAYVRVSRRTSVSVRSNYIVFRILERATTRGR